MLVYSMLGRCFRMCFFMRRLQTPCRRGCACGRRGFMPASAPFSAGMFGHGPKRMLFLARTLQFRVPSRNVCDEKKEWKNLEFRKIIPTLRLKSML